MADTKWLDDADALDDFERLLRIARAAEAVCRADEAFSIANRATTDLSGRRWSLAVEARDNAVSALRRALAGDET